MIAMNYRFVLPADYDMAVIRQRIASKGHLLDGFPELVFKAWLYADIHSQTWPATQNVYAPFYLWRGSGGMRQFLCSPGFAALQGDFGRPDVLSWIPLYQHVGTSVQQARFAVRELSAIPSSLALAGLEQQQQQWLDTQQQRGALASISAFDPQHWQLLRFTLWAAPVELQPQQEGYELGYLAQGQAVSGAA
ncbi:DUF4865 family protein [Pokkaliibacter sp. MBI-7]|uniref:DUF4865 family protein n=1 Tax=Pokkaliibacter sp. MBI-7 TaxID=3040600 RepID=UPI002448C4B7|nr:DUF4865 family protein [Pokkaliibacter sp. MBI-7]MDH2432082.1 DUF4865 family protein [Pokkaliibacter sp. MBI-7]